MSIKESSDELNPPVVTADAIPKPKTRRSFKDYLALAIATCGVGYLPLAPGTWGSILAVVFYVILHGLWFPPAIDPITEGFRRSFLIIQLIILTTVVVIGTWAASRTERILRIKDPGRVVIDEVAGQFVALMAQMWIVSPISVLTAFILFRIFDIVKPYPARKLERLAGGVGIMGDDLVAGVYAAIGVAVIFRFVGH